MFSNVKIKAYALVIVLCGSFSVYCCANEVDCKSFTSQNAYIGTKEENIIPVAKVVTVKKPDYPSITKLERNIFNRDYKAEDISERLARIENKLYGNSFPDNSLAERVNKITETIDNREYDDSNENKPITQSTEEQRNISSQDSRNNSIFASIGKLEMTMAGRTFENEDINSRVGRLEKQAFGATQTGNIEKRISMLSSVPENSIMNQPIMQNYQMLGGNSFSSENFDNSNNNPNQNNQFQNSTQGTGLVDIIQALAPIVLGFLDRKNNAQNYYPQPTGYYNPVTGSYTYPTGYYNNPRAYNYPNYTSTTTYYPNPNSSFSGSDFLNTGMGAGVRILP